MDESRDSGTGLRGQRPGRTAIDGCDTAALLAALFQQSPDAILVIADDGTILLSNDEFLSLSGLGPEWLALPQAERQVDLFRLLAEPEQGSEFSRRAFLQHEGVLSGEFRLADGRSVAIRTRPLITDDGARLGRAFYYGDITPRVAVEDALGESEAQFHAVADSAPCAIWLQKDGTFVFVNRTIEAQTGYTRDELLQAGFMLRLVHPDDRPRAAALVAARTAGAAWKETLELRLVTKSGETRWFSVSGSQIVIRGEIYGLGSAVDITGTKNAEAALESSKASLLALIENTADTVWSVDRELKLVAGNAAFRRSVGGLIGHELAEGDPVLDPRVPEDAVNRWRHWYALALAGERVSFELFSEGADGDRWKDVSLNPIRDGFGNVVGIAGFGRDVTKRKRSEEALRASEALYRDLVETAAEGIWVIDSENRTTFVNQRMADILRCSPQDMLGTTPVAYVGERDQAEAWANLERRRQGIAASHEFTLRAKDGGSVQTLLSTRPLVSEDGSYLGAFGMITDVSAWKTAEAQSREAQMRAAILSERGRIAQELHDDVAQSFFAIGLASQRALRLPAGETMPVLDIVTAIKDLAESGGRQIRSAIHALSPSEAADGLDAELRRVVETWASRSGLPIDYAGAPDSLSLTPLCVAAIVNASQELLANVWRHARASAVEVTVVVELGTLALHIMDDGTGDAEAVKRAVELGTSFGLPQLLRRLASVGGSLTVDDRPGGGLVMTAQVPFVEGQ